MAEPRRTATLLAVARQLETDACDDMLDLLDRLLAGLLTRTQRIEQRDRLRGLPALDVAARQLRDAVTVLLDPPDSGAGVLSAVWSVLEERGISRDQLADAVHAVGELSREPASWAEELLSATATSAGSCPPCSTACTWVPPPADNRCPSPSTRCGTWKDAAGCSPRRYPWSWPRGYGGGW